MRRLKRFIAAAIIASTIFLTASFGREPDEPPEEVETISPAYDDSAEIASLESRRQAHERAERAKRHIARVAKAQAIASKPKQPSRSQDYVGKAQAYMATAYTAGCSGCSGITKTGVDIRDTIYYQGLRVIAVDPRVIPLGSVVQVKLSDGTVFIATAQDTGGAIKGQIIDIAHSTKTDAANFGRQTIEVRIIKKGG